MNTTTRILLTALLCTAAVACSKKVKETPPAPVEPTPPAVTEPAPVSGVYTPEDLDTDSCLRTRVVYFDFDQDAVRPEFEAAMACHAKYLSDRPSSRMNLEGHADERGSREYNIGLGERRAQAVRRVLQLQGAGAQQLTTVSYGEERPAATGSDEEAWRLNRRVELVYR